MKGSGLGQMQHSMNNLFLETASLPPNVKNILNHRGDVIVNSIRIGRNPVQSAIQGMLKIYLQSRLINFFICLWSLKLLKVKSY